MTAVLLSEHGGPEVLEISTDTPIPVPRAGQVLVRVAAAAVNNTDIWTREGAYGLPGDPGAKAGWRGPLEFPRVQGGDIAGVVEAVGGGVDPELVGRRVLVDPAIYRGDGPDDPPVGLLGSEADGGFAQFAVAGAGQVHDMTDSPLSAVELAALPVSYGTALGMLERIALREGERILVTGASGGVGLAAVQLAAARGAQVLALTSSRTASTVREAGAEHIVLRDQDVPSQLAIVAPDGLDCVADVTGGPTIDMVMPSLRDDGRWGIVGAIAGAVIEFDLRRLYLHNIALVGSSMHTRRHFAALAGLAREGSLHPIIERTFRLDQIADAQELFASGNRVGKIVLIPETGR